MSPNAFLAILTLFAVVWSAGTTILLVLHADGNLLPLILSAFS